MSNLRSHFYLFLVILTSFICSCNLKNHSNMIRSSRHDASNNTTRNDIGHFDCEYNPTTGRYSLDYTYPTSNGFAINNKYGNNKNSSFFSHTNYYNSSKAADSKFLPGVYLHTSNDILYPIRNVHNFPLRDTTKVNNLKKPKNHSNIQNIPVTNTNTVNNTTEPENSMMLNCLNIFPRKYTEQNISISFFKLYRLCYLQQGLTFQRIIFTKQHPRYSKKFFQYIQISEILISNPSQISSRSWMFDN